MPTDGSEKLNETTPIPAYTQVLVKFFKYLNIHDFRL